MYHEIKHNGPKNPLFHFTNTTHVPSESPKHKRSPNIFSPATPNTVQAVPVPVSHRHIQHHVPGPTVVMQHPTPCKLCQCLFLTGTCSTTCSTISITLSQFPLLYCNTQHRASCSSACFSQAYPSPCPPFAR